MSFSRILGALVKSNDRRFISLLCEHADLALKSLKLLRLFEASCPDARGRADEIKAVEREGDEIRRVFVDELFRTYSTPFDREDLFSLSRGIDDIIDAADETARELFTYRIEPLDQLHEMTDVLIDGARHIRFAVEALLDYPLIAADHAIRAKRSENRMDTYYHEAVDSLFDSSKGIGQMFKEREVYRHLKNSADRIDRAADDISMIVIKCS